MTLCSVASKITTFFTTVVQNVVTFFWLMCRFSCYHDKNPDIWLIKCRDCRELTTNLFTTNAIVVIEIFLTRTTITTSDLNLDIQKSLFKFKNQKTCG